MPSPALVVYVIVMMLRCCTLPFTTLTPGKRAGCTLRAIPGPSQLLVTIQSKQASQLHTTLNHDGTCLSWGCPFVEMLRLSRCCVCLDDLSCCWLLASPHLT